MHFSAQEDRLFLQRIHKINIITATEIHSLDQPMHLEHHLITLWEQPLQNMVTQTEEVTDLPLDICLHNLRPNSIRM